MLSLVALDLTEINQLYICRYYLDYVRYVKRNLQSLNLAIVPISKLL